MAYSVASTCTTHANAIQTDTTATSVKPVGELKKWELATTALPTKHVAGVDSVCTVTPIMSLATELTTQL